MNPGSPQASKNGGPSLFLAFCLLLTISLSVRAQSPTPTPSPTPAGNSSQTSDDLAADLPSPSVTATRPRTITVRPAETVVAPADPANSPDPAGPPDPRGPAPAPTQGGGFGSAVSTFGRAQTQDRFVPARNPRIAVPIWGKHLNAILNGFAFGAGLGIGLQLTTADSIPGVELRFTAITSTRLYRLFEGEAYVPHFFGEKTHADVWFQYQRRTKDNFFGIGPKIPNTSQTNFDKEVRSFYGLIQHDFEPRLVAGIFAGVANTSTYDGENDKDIPFHRLFSGNPNVVPELCPNRIPRTCWAPGFQQNTEILSYGGYGEYDRRNDEHGLTRGVYLFGRVASHDGLDLDNAFSDYGWVEGTIDGRAYIPVLSDKTSIAFRTQALLQKTKGGSQIPFYDMAFLGGREYVRGFKNYRWRANNSLMFSAELRQTVYALKIDRGVDVVVFGDTGQVWGDNRSQTNPFILANQSFDSSNWRSGFGGGVQYRHNKSLGARIELGHSNERNLIYFSLSRGF